MPKAWGTLTEVVWTEPALAHLRAIRAYIEEFNPKAARSVAVSLKALGDSLRQFPYRGRPVRGKPRLREILSAYPYVIRYLIDGDSVVILRVRHTARRPI